MLAKVIDRRAGDKTIEGSIVVICTDDNKPIAVFGQDLASGAIWSIKAGDEGFDTYVKSNGFAHTLYSSEKTQLD